MLGERSHLCKIVKICNQFLCTYTRIKQEIHTCSLFTFYGLGVDASKFEYSSVEHRYQEQEGPIGEVEKYTSLFGYILIF